jgi:hypothetical protein
MGTAASRPTQCLAEIWLVNAKLLAPPVITPERLTGPLSFLLGMLLSRAVPVSFPFSYCWEPIFFWASFLTFVVIDNCLLYGFSGKPSHAYSCTSGLNRRTIQCNPGFYAVGGVNWAFNITLPGNTPFLGCEARPL